MLRFNRRGLGSMLVVLRFFLIFLSIILSKSVIGDNQGISPISEPRNNSLNEPLDLKSSPKILVVSAHLDDEILWFEPWLAIADLILTPTVYPISEFMKNHIVLRYLSLNKWVAPMGITDHEKAKMIAHDRNYRHEWITDNLLSDILNQYVAQHDVIVSHSAWGEYGHEQHQQIFCVLQRLVISYKKDYWIWNGIPDIRSSDSGYPTHLVTLVNRQGELPHLEMAVNQVHYRQVRDLFLRAEAEYPRIPGEPGRNMRFWTWDRNETQDGNPGYQPPSYAKYYKVIDKGKILYDADQIKAIILDTGTFPDNSLMANCLMGTDVSEH